MDKVAYDDGYKAAIEAIKQALKNQANGNSGAQGSQGGQQPEPGQNTSINPQNNDGPLSKQAQQGQGQSGQGQSGSGSGSGQGSQISVDPGQAGGAGGGQGGQSGIPGGSQSSGASKEARSGEVSKLGGTFIDKETGKKIAQESGYEGDEIGNDENVEGKWAKIAQQVARGIGSGRGGALGRLVNEIYKPAKNWKAELKKFIGHAVGGIQTKNAWGRKYALQYDDIRRYDKKMDESLDRVIFMIDTSGSNVACLPLIISESAHIIESKKIKSITYMYYDYGVVGWETLKSSENFHPDKLKKVGGGGGTSFSRAVVDAEKIIKSNSGKKKIDLLMVFTDGDTCEEVKEKPKWAKSAMMVITDRPGADECEWCKTLYINSEDVK